MPIPARLQQLSAIEVSEGKPLPSEFRIFREGLNPSDRGPDEPFIFDEKSAALIMADFSASGTDMMLDLEHAATDEDTIKLRSDATDAMCWFKLAVRDGELWAVGADWTPEGERRVRNKLQRYLSPTFLTDKDGRVTALYNVALVSRPGLYSATDVASLRVRKCAPGAAELSALLKSAVIKALSGRGKKHES